MKVSVIGVPLDMGANRRGTDMGPSALRYAFLAKKLCALGIEVRDLGNVPVPVPESREIGRLELIYLDEIIKVCNLLASEVKKIISDGAFPLVLGGDHSMAMGTLAGIALSYQEAGLLWFDAHGDFNDLETSTTGNIHGMSLASIVGKGSPELVRCAGIWPKVKEERTCLIGVRSLDRKERDLLKQSGVTVFTIKDYR